MTRRPTVALSAMNPYLVRSAGLCAVYYGAALLGLRYASVGESISLIWPPTGIALAAITMWGDRYWPAIALGAFFANAATNIPLGTAGAIAVGNTLEALVAAHLLRPVTGKRPQLDDFGHVRRLVLLAAPAGTLIAAIMGTMSLAMSGVLTSATHPTAVAVWWIGDLLGALIVAPIFFTWATPAQTIDSTRRLAEIVLLCIGTAVAAELGITRYLSGVLLIELNYTYLLFPFVIWAALRFGARGASLMTLTVAVLSVVRTVQGGSPFVGETSLRTLFSLAFYLVAVAVTGLVLAAAIRSERQQATRALTESEGQLKRALTAARMGVWVWSVDTNTLTWDDNLRRLYGLDPGTRITSYEDFISRVHLDDRERVSKALRRVLEEGGDLDYEFRIVWPDGRIRWITDQGEVRRDADGRPHYLTGVCTDVTERRMGEERLRQAHRMESVGRLAGGVAHETNNQMSVVLGAADFILKRSDLPEAVRADVEFIQKAAERTAAVTAQLLAFSRRQLLKAEVLDLNALIRGWEPVLRRVMGEDCGVMLNLAPEVGTVKADPGQLEQVLLNLALNARDAMPRGGRISVETAEADLSDAYLRTKPGTAVKPGRYAMVAVSDTGHGMDRETLSHVFEPFFTTKGVGQGTGLGLSTVYGIIKQSDGYIWVYSEPGQGTTFKIYLPVSGAPATRAPRESQPARVVAEETILVVEDDTPVRQVMARSLEEVGYRVQQAGSAKEALALVQRGERIHLMLTDVVMPGMHGRELAERLESVAPGVPVLFTSGYTDAEIERRGLLRPGVAFVQKPLTPGALIRAVRKTLASARNGRKSSAPEAS